MKPAVSFMGLHSLNAFNLLASPADQVSEDYIQFFVENAQVPPHLKEPIPDETYGVKVPLFRRASNNVRITIFYEGHDVVHKAALSWLSQQEKSQNIVSVSPQAKLSTFWGRTKTQR